MPPKLPAEMPWQIYQAYLQGPNALLGLFEQAFGRHALYGPRDPDIQQQAIDDLAAHIARLTAQIEKLQAEATDLSSRNCQLQRRNSELEAQLSKDSHNSSRPPATDPVWRKRTQSLRRPSGKARGGQVGHRGVTRRQAARPDRIVEHRPSQCRSCHSSLSAGQTIRHFNQQVIDIVPAKLRITEHRLALLRCRACGTTTKGEFPTRVRSGVQYGPGVLARVLYLHQYQLLPYARTSEAMRDLFDCRLSSGTVANIVRRCAENLIGTELKIKHKLRRCAVIHADETGLRVKKKGQYVHVASNARLTHYGFDSRRGRSAMDEIGVLPKYRGTCVHDAWWSYDYYTSCRHALCGAHILRELTFFAELSSEQKVWAAPLKELLVEIKAAVAQAHESGDKRLATDEQAALSERYDQLIQQGLRINPPAETCRAPGEQTKTSSTLPSNGVTEKQARNLLLRMQRRREEVLRFMTDFSVPFDNNQAERDLRMVKLQQKVSGCFRSEEGARQFCRIRGYISTMRKQGREVLVSIERACRGAPLSPT